MKVHATEAILPTLTATVAVVSLAFWLMTSPPSDLEPRTPGRDGTIDRSGQTARPEPGQPIAGAGIASDIPGQWPGFLGPGRDSISTGGPPLARSWPAEGPPVLWSIDVAEGYAGAAISDGRVYVLDYDEEAEADTLRCLSLDDGREIWRNSYPVVVAFYHGMTRTVPTIVGDYVITMGPRCHLACWDAATGESHWLIDLERDHGTRVPEWYTGQCPLVDQDRLIVAPCGDAMLMAIDYRTGDVIWQSPNPKGWNMTHVSVVPMEFQGRRTYVYCASGGVAGVAADDGTLLWETTAWKEINATSPSPVVLPDDRLFLSRGYGSGALMLQLLKTDSGIEARSLFELTPKQFSSEQQTPIYRDGHLFGIRKIGAKTMVCLDLDGNEVWDSGGDRFGLGPYLFADDLLLILDDDATLTAAEATPAGYKRLARHKVLPGGHDAWGPMAMVAGRLILRDMTRLVCLDLRAN
ncbi:polyvinylalcohol dehydrogenase [Rhodopirellula sp. SM50]|nr:PQQ-binding-like beta-propeller repeat protein [Rhodopirellula sp. SM50]PAY16306.1 polyvinylalcohol dehydrogenase [Rhodopirellula sp. SM50]